jgi:large subunit ribosomal protein L28
MSKVCAICGKTKANGGHITRKGLAKKAGGIGTHVVKNTKRTFEVNLQSVKINANGTIKTVKMCAGCIRTGNYEKA